jgi:hypothetical protein
MTYANNFKSRTLVVFEKIKNAAGAGFKTLPCGFKRVKLG